MAGYMYGAGAYEGEGYGNEMDEEYYGVGSGEELAEYQDEEENSDSQVAESQDGSVDVEFDEVGEEGSDAIEEESSSDFASEVEGSESEASDVEENDAVDSDIETGDIELSGTEDHELESSELEESDVGSNDIENSEPEDNDIADDSDLEGGSEAQYYSEEEAESMSEDHSALDENSDADASDDSDDVYEYDSGVEYNSEEGASSLASDDSPVAEPETNSDQDDMGEQQSVDDFGSDDDGQSHSQDDHVASGSDIGEQIEAYESDAACGEQETLSQAHSEAQSILSGIGICINTKVLTLWISTTLMDLQAGKETRRSTTTKGMARPTNAIRKHITTMNTVQPLTCSNLTVAL